MVVDKLPEPQTVIPLVSEQRRLSRLRRVGQNVAQNRQWFEDVGECEDPKRRVVIVARRDAEGDGGPGPVHQQ
jgi:hypothetical protein